jgi:protease-4
MQIRPIVRRLAANGSRALRRLGASSVLPAESGHWLHFELGDALPESSGGFGPGRRPHLGLMDWLRTLARGGDDPRVAGCTIELRGTALSFAQALSLRRGIEAFRACGKPVAVWAESLTAAQYLALSAADRIWLAPGGNLFLVGLRTERFFLRDLLERLDIKPEVVHIGEFKSAGDMLTRAGMSEREREQIEAWQSDLFDELVDGIAQGRGLAPERVRALIDEGPFPVAAAQEAGLVDGALHADEVERALEPLAPLPPPGLGGARRVVPVDAVAYWALEVADPGWQPLDHDLPTLAYVLATGGVHRGAGARGIASQTMGKLLDELREEPGVRGVALRIDSPGGDALASDLLYRSVERLRREKPVVVSMGDVAASGGYYMAAAADAVYAETGTITGSIGVVGGKLNIGGLYERMGVAKEAIQKGARAGLLSEARGFTPDERAAVRREMEAIYGTFLDRVAAGRQISRKGLEKLAQGRIWSGRRAQSLGLVDFVGGPLDALEDLRRRAGLGEAESFILTTLPRALRIPELVASLLGRSASRTGTSRGPWLL